MPPMVVITPHTEPRSHGVPRPVSEPSSESASAKPMEMPAPTEAAIPTRNVSQVLWVAKAAANSGASVDTEPRSEEHTSELQSQSNLVCRLLLEKKNNE